LDIVDAVHKKDKGENLTEQDEKLIKFRQDAKPVNFGIAYGITKYGLADQLNCSVQKAQYLIDTWYNKAFPQAGRWIKHQEDYLWQNLFTRTIRGRKRHLSSRARGLPKNKFRMLLRPFVNHPVQGSSADMTKEAMIRVHKALAKFGADAKLVLLIHDELIVLCKEELSNQVREELVNGMETTIGDVHFPVDTKVARTLSKKDTGLQEAA